MAALASHEPCQELAELHLKRFRILGRLDDVQGMADTVAELLALAERLASPRVEAVANLVASMFSLGQADVATARQRALHALAIGESLPEGQRLAICCDARSVLAVIGMHLGEHHFMRHHAERGLATSQRRGVPYMEILLRLRLAYANFLCGAWDESRRDSMEAIALARRVGHLRDLAYSLAERAMILALQGVLSEAEACLSDAKPVFDIEQMFDMAAL